MLFPDTMVSDPPQYYLPMYLHLRAVTAGSGTVSDIEHPSVCGGGGGRYHTLSLELFVSTAGLFPIRSADYISRCHRAEGTYSYTMEY